MRNRYQGNHGITKLTRAWKSFTTLTKALKTSVSPCLDTSSDQKQLGTTNDPMYSLLESEKLVPVTTGAELDASGFLVRVGALAYFAEFLLERGAREGRGVAYVSGNNERTFEACRGGCHVYRNAIRDLPSRFSRGLVGAPDQLRVVNAGKRVQGRSGTATRPLDHLDDIENRWLESVAYIHYPG
ncbi:hypothetical protein AG1IA_05716 [Rhizoctonia solani AG-1 IA]|uniref:Uncharacterized protein n=1 Tax=Thanatephorus cucumeris (strain AG1-IA) TaxID=983506 RepID=L8WU12_THACA|nr:hypothetical protein AG1IA_05716 [Rhizoctonia solani AG-1 IA]